MEYKLLFILLAISATANVTIGVGAEATIKAYADASSSGYNHGEKDCNKYQNGNGNLYITGYNKDGESTGPAHHTNAFNNAYLDGWTDAGCSSNEFNSLNFNNDGGGNTRVETNTAVDDSFNNRDSVVQPQSQSANTIQSNSCPQLIVNGDCLTGQEQATNNEFAQANRADN